MKKHVFRQKLLATLQSREIPRLMYFTDTETTPLVVGLSELHTFNIGWIFKWDSTRGMIREMVRETFFKDPVKYNEYFEKEALENKKIFIYGHNIFFDLQCSGFFKYFTDTGWQLDWIYDKGLTYILRIVLNKNVITVVSSTNYYDCSLKELGKMIGLEKKEVDFKKVTKKKLKEYCYRDTEICMRGIWYYIEFIQKHDLGRMAMTKASQSFVTYRTKFMTKKIYIHTDKESFDLERAAYMGGRTEAFRIGEVKGNEFMIIDVNSMYPFVMSVNDYPSKLIATLKDVPQSQYERILRGYGMIAEVDLNTDEPVYSVRQRGKLIFPVGNFTTYLSTRALRYALEHDHIKKFIRASVFIMEDLFKEYVQYFKNLRQEYDIENNKIMVKLCKYMHNAFYGKWGERNIITDMRDNESDIEYMRREIWDAMTTTTWVETIFMNKIIMQHYEGEGFHSFPAISAHITEDARLYLWEIIKMVGIDKSLYCDTDSVIINSKDSDSIQHLIDPIELGKLKVQERFSYLLINGAKNYFTNEKRHIKGIPKDAIEIKPGTYEFKTFQRQVACLRAGQQVGVKVSPMTRTLKHSYDKGEVLSSGVVIPFRF
jgi:hypothetical protein